MVVSFCPRQSAFISGSKTVKKSVQIVSCSDWMAFFYFELEILNFTDFDALYIRLGRPSQLDLCT